MTEDDQQFDLNSEDLVHSKNEDDDDLENDEEIEVDLSDEESEDGDDTDDDADIINAMLHFDEETPWEQ